ncbi:MAG: 23S rRNA (uracil(1939)-C(5))-methyltransferase RlmD, partial [Saprospiraceae bacterium]
MRGRKRKILENIIITGIADKGKGVGRTPDGQVIFVEEVAPGDVVDVMVMRKKSGFMEGKPTQYRQYSADRVTPFCEHYGVCGGCKWQHLSYEAQLQHKHQTVENAIQRIGKVKVLDFQPILPADPTVYYRNKLEFTFSNWRWLTKEEIASGIPLERQRGLGFHRPGEFDKIVNIQHCWLQPEPSNEIRNAVRDIAIAQDLSFFDNKYKHGFLRSMMVRTSTIGETMLLFSFFENDQAKITPFLNAVIEKFPNITTIIYCINIKVNDFLLDLDMLTYHGKGYIEEQLGHVRFKIGPKSFFQTNTHQGKALYDIAVEFADLQGGENVYDLYTGVGSIALYVAQHARQVVGIEEIEAAIVDARENAVLNNIENAIFYAGDVKDILTAEFVTKYGKPDVLITDPPRAGMQPQVVDMLLQMETPKIVYVSCNPATQARDLQLLSAKY